MASEQQKGAGTPVPVRDRFIIYTGSPLPDLSSNSAQAFLAEDKRGEVKSLFALMVKPGMPVRLQALRVLKGLESPGLMQLLDWAPVDWPLANRKVMALIYERPLGGRVTPDLTSEFTKLDESDAVRKVLRPVGDALAKLGSHNLAHRSIRPTNMFWATPERDRVVLGDCCAGPPAFEQPVIIETIESGMAHPAGHGNGGSDDDFYALGTSLMFLLLGRNPMPNMDADEIRRVKIQRGSFAALVGDERMPIQIIELLRGLMCDVSTDRWAVDSVNMWLDGRRLVPLQMKVEKHATRGFQFLGNDYNTARELAIAFSRNWDAAMPYVLDGRLELWIRRSLDNKDKAQAVMMAVQTSGFVSGDKATSNDVLMARICMVLDGRAPLRYKALSVMPDGLGHLLAVNMATGADVRLIVEMLMRDISKAWLDSREAYSPDNAVIDQKLRQQKIFIERATIGNGIERVLYELNEAAVCASPFTLDDYVLEIRDLLPALNAIGRKAEGKNSPIDRHVAAFMQVRANFDIDRQMSELADPSLERSTLGMLNLLATIQWRLGQTGLLGLASWVGGLVQPAINSYHNRQKRRELEREVPRLVRQGSLVDLARLLDNSEERFKDAQGFEQARAEWLEAATEIRDIQSGMSNKDESVIETAQQVAALVAVSIALVTLLLVAVTRVL